MHSAHSENISEHLRHLRIIFSSFIPAAQAGTALESAAWKINLKGSRPYPQMTQMLAANPLTGGIEASAGAVDLVRRRI